MVEFQQPPLTLSISSTISAWLAKNPAFIRIEGNLLAYARPLHALFPDEMFLTAHIVRAF